MYGTDCEKNLNADCYKNWMTIFSIGNIKSNEGCLSILSITNFINIIVLIFIFQRIRYNQRVMHNNCDF